MRLPQHLLGATSAYGLQIVLPDSDGDGRPERVKLGQPGAMFMAGQWGPGGTAGTIYRIDGSPARSAFSPPSEPIAPRVSAILSTTRQPISSSSPISIPASSTASIRRAS